MDIEEQYDKIYRFCYYKVHHVQTAEDITQETFLRFLQSGYAEQGRELHYLYTIARNLCIDEHRKPDWEEMPEEFAEGHDLEQDVVERIHIRNALSKLQEEDRELLILRYVNDEPLGVIGEITGLSRFALYRKLNGIKKEFRNLLEKGSLNE